MRGARAAASANRSADNLTNYDYNAANELTSLHDKVSDATKPLWRRSDGRTYYAYDANGAPACERLPVTGQVRSGGKAPLVTVGLERAAPAFAFCGQLVYSLFE